MRRKVLTLVITGKLVIGSLLVGKGFWIHGKAMLAQSLTQMAWGRTLQGERDVKPWPWADTWPLARLTVPALGVDSYVLAGSSGRTLAFGPGHVDGSAVPGRRGNCVIVAHRDTQFAFLRDLRQGDAILLETPDRLLHRYTVVDRRIVHERDTSILEPSSQYRLTLITCYPFDAILPGTPLRCVVTAEIVAS